MSSRPPACAHNALQAQFDDLLDRSALEREQRLALLAATDPALAEAVRGLLDLDDALLEHEEPPLPQLARLLYGRCGTRRPE